jgi:DNA-binding beta-propeller fold protein YncE
MKRSKTNDTKQNKKQKFQPCEIIDSIGINMPRDINQTPCGKFLIGVEKHCIFKYNLKTKQKFRIAGSVDQYGHQDGTRDESRFHSPQGLSLSKDLKTLFVADFGNYVIRAICAGTGVTTTITGQVNKYEQVDGPKEKACFKKPRSLKLSSNGNMLYVADYLKIRTICITTGQVNTIHTFENEIHDFSLSPDSKHVIICFWKTILKYNLETGKSEIILKGGYFVTCDLSKNGQILFIANEYKHITVVNLITNQVIDTITSPSYFETYNLILSTNNKHLYVCCHYDNKIIILDISKYCTNFKTFTQSQLSKYSFLPRQVVQRISI